MGNDCGVSFLQLVASAFNVSLNYCFSFAAAHLCSVVTEISSRNHLLTSLCIVLVLPKNIPYLVYFIIYGLMEKAVSDHIFFVLSFLLPGNSLILRIHSSI